MFAYRTSLVLFILLSNYSFGLIVKLSDMHVMAKNSDIVIHGYVGDQTVKYDNRGRIITLTEVEIIDNLRGGKTGEVITIYQVGGKKDGIIVPPVGGHYFKPGQQIIYFGLKLGKNFVSYGPGQGKFDIDPENYIDAVKEDLGSIYAVNKINGNKLDFFKPAPLSFPEVEELKNEIRLMLKE